MVTVCCLSQVQEDVKFHVLLTSYETPLPEIGLLKKLTWESLVVDEGHRLKNKDSRLFQVYLSVPLQLIEALPPPPLLSQLSHGLFNIQAESLLVPKFQHNYLV